MTEQQNQGQPLPPDRMAPNACASRPCCPLQSRWGLLLWALLIAAIAYLQWPMPKGTFYKATNAQAPASAVAWRADYAAALAEAGRNRKPMLLDFTAPWCPPCKVMTHEVWPDPEVADTVNHMYVPVLVDVDDPQNAEVAQRYDVRGIPSVLVLDAEGHVVKQGGFMSKSDMLNFLKPST
jgi:thiol:disulfide interchange protein